MDVIAEKTDGWTASPSASGPRCLDSKEGFCRGVSAVLRSKLRDCNVVRCRSEIRFRRYNYRELEQGSLPPRSNPSNANGIPMTLDAVT